MSQPLRIALHNGEMTASGGLRVDPFGPLALWGEGIFDTFRVHEGRVLYPRPHIDRMLASLESVWGPNDALRDRVLQTWSQLSVEAARFSSGRGRILVAPMDENRSEFDIFGELVAFTPPPDEIYEKGVSLGFSMHPHPGLGHWGKTTSALWSRTAVDEARRRNLDEVLLCRNEIIVETAWSAVLWRESATTHWWTPSASLGGLASTTLEALRNQGVRIDDVVATRERLRYAESIVLLSSLRLAIGVNSLGERGYESPDEAARPLRELLLST